MNDRPSRFHAWLKRALAVFLDVCLIALGIYLAVMLRYNGHMSQWQMGRVAYFSPLMLFTFVAFLLVLGVYKITWRYADMRDMFKLIGVCIAATAANLLINRLFHLRYPRLVIGISGVISMLLLIVSRYGWILLQDFMFMDKSKKHVRRALIMGAGEQGLKLAKSLRQQAEGGVRRDAVAFIDEDLDKLYRKENGVPVEGTLADVKQVVKRKRIDDVILADESLNANQLRGAYLSAREMNCNVLIVDENGAMREASIEDVLAGWTDTPLGEDVKRALSGQSYVITGAAGCVGRELSKQLMNVNPSLLTLLDASEDALYELKRALGDGARYLVRDICIYNDIARALEDARPFAVFHAAACTCEELAPLNALKQIEVNILGAELLQRAARACGARAFIMVSTTGAHRPRTQTDASRALGECAVLAHSDADMKTFIVRVDNIVTSDNGWLKRYLACADKGEGVCVYEGERLSFLSAGDAASGMLALCTSEEGGVYLMDPEDPVDLYEVARALARERGFTASASVEHANDDIEAQKAEATGVMHVYRARESALDAQTLSAALAAAREAYTAGDEGRAAAALMGLVSEVRT